MKTPTAIIIALAMQIALSCATDYCKVKSCGDHQTVCLYPTAGPSAKCTNVEGSGLSDEDKQRIVDVHNMLRQKVAGGNEPRGWPGHQPSAKNMPNLEWDDELAFVAQRWADQCIVGNDICRDVDRFSVGQNIATYGHAGNIIIESLVQSWYDEVQFFNRDQVSRFTNQGENGQTISHYTQLVWAKTTKIGCGATKSKENDTNKLYLVCNYGPTGNIVGEPVYEIT